ncbi:MAG TPA: glycerol-3-phosphate 1-O-acyltransferase PlsY [Alphaproteobacteria bacterium]
MPSPLGNFAYTWPFLAAAIAGYILGSVPFGLVLTRLAGLGDIRKIGSGNIGATNVLRTGNRALAALTLILDGGKGAAAVLIANRFGPDMAVLAGGGAVVGHLFPVWLKFRGGKGVATGLGVLLAAAPLAGIAACATWLAMAVLFRYSSLAALTSFALSPLYSWFAEGPQMAELAAFIAVLVILRHHANIRRLLKGTESKIGQKR